jgi:hypothetical protein
MLLQELKDTKLFEVADRNLYNPIIQVANNYSICTPLKPVTLRIESNVYESASFAKTVENINLATLNYYTDHFVVITATDWEKRIIEAEQIIGVFENT